MKKTVLLFLKTPEEFNVLKIKTTTTMSSNNFIWIVIILIINIGICLVKSLDPYHEVLETELTPKGRSVLKKRITPLKEMNTEYWFEQAQNSLKKRLQQKQNKGKAKNIIFFLGDGMSIATITAARILKGQRQGLSGEGSELTMETFPYTGLSKVQSISEFEIRKINNSLNIILKFRPIVPMLKRQIPLVVLRLI